jgi:hypothetical protein
VSRGRRLIVAGVAHRAGPVAVALAAVATVSIWSPAVEACGSTPPAFWVLRGTTPSDGDEAVSIDTALSFEGRAVASAFSDDRDGDELAGTLHVRVRATGASTEVPGKVSGWSRGARPSAVWRPEGRLAPDTVYEVYARIDNVAPTPAEAAAWARDAHFTFRTGTAELAPLRLTAPINLSREVFAAPSDAECLLPCGGRDPSCVPVRFFQRIRLRVNVPAIAGGWASGNFRIDGQVVDQSGVLSFTPPLHDFVGAAGGSFALLLPESATATRLCVPLTVSDARGTSVKAETACIDWAPHTFSEVPKDGGSGGCSLGKARSIRGGGSATAACLAAIAWVLIARRVRRRVRGRACRRGMNAGAE